MIMQINLNYGGELKFICNVICGPQERLRAGLAGGWSGQTAHIHRICYFKSKY